MKRLFAALLLLTLLAGAAAAAEPAAPAAKAAPKSHTAASSFTPAPSGWYAEFRGGVATQDLPDLDANIAYWEGLGVQFLNSPGDLHRFSQAPTFTLEGGLRRGTLSYGLETQWQRQVVDNFTAGTFSGSIDMTSLFSVIDARATVTARPAKLYGFEVGASAGWAFAHCSERYTLSVYSAPQDNVTINGIYDANAPSLGAHLGWRRPLVGSTWLLARAAWSWRDFGEMTGKEDIASGGVSYAYLTDLRRFDNGEKAQVDGSGFQFTVGLSYTLGGKR